MGTHSDVKSVPRQRLRRCEISGARNAQDDQGDTTKLGPVQRFVEEDDAELDDFDAAYTRRFPQSKAARTRTIAFLPHDGRVELEVVASRPPPVTSRIYVA